MSDGKRELIRFEEVTKAYGATLALKKVSFTCQAGEVRAVLGENGAGKSTLMKLMSGVIQPTLGKIYVDGQPVRLESPGAARDLGIVCMFQELSLVPDLSVRDNILLGAKEVGMGRLSKGNLTRARAILDRIEGAHIPMKRKVADLSLPERQQVEIAKAICRAPRLLILDEATSALNASVVQKVFGLVRDLRDQGTGILFISHRFHEVDDLADSISVFRNGEHVDTFQKGKHSYSEIIAKMIGQSLTELFPPRLSPIPDGAPLLKVDDLSFGDTLRGVSLEVRPGEVLGLGGLDGQGQMVLVQALFGLLKKTGGQISENGHPLQLKSPRAAKAPPTGIALVPEDRKTEGLIPELSIRENMELAALGRHPFGLTDLDNGIDPDLFTRFTSEMELVCRNFDQPVSDLSGGNQQKVALTKWLALQPRCLLLADPTRGIDVKTKTQIYRLIRQLAAEGVAIILLSTDYEELIHLCDSVHVFYDGAVRQVLEGPELTAENIIAASLNVNSVPVQAAQGHPAHA
ncbi:sugar ABC transporter ATP-binding protein [Roseibium sp. CAU 1637]|uniref:Sugar ABC transporter ATP-binding protein n=1 Tax=Roseibium limicola TaxID=2816037 RepID=A0A939J7L7_9HYPH|nr:sugar ABC transporter ATP-binding protein [Roseibium limicola]MBO0346312.1 sugar ABC transporter ATP-binding protein [Roseibium limicola]